MFYTFIVFSRGTCANCADFFGFTCCNPKDSRVDWTRTYDIPKNQNPLAYDFDEEDNNTHKVKIPLPYVNPSSQSSYTYSSDGESSKQATMEFSEPLKQS